ncbi:MAG: hypothetical protein KBB51_00925 [Candidatus Moranbacteria bacterium]|nr:hypothetical protein [Candidatus Moranbacteria bacterium]
MRQSQLFTRVLRQVPKDEVSKNAQLLIRAGFIHKEMAGVYSFLPLGLRVLNKVIGGRKTLESGEVEIKRRGDGSVEKTSLEGLVEYFRTVVTG